MPIFYVLEVQIVREIVKIFKEFMMLLFLRHQPTLTCSRIIQLLVFVSLTFLKSSSKEEKIFTSDGN